MRRVAFDLDRMTVARLDQHAVGIPASGECGGIEQRYVFAGTIRDGRHDRTVRRAAQPISELPPTDSASSLRKSRRRSMAALSSMLRVVSDGMSSTR